MTTEHAEFASHKYTYVQRHTYQYVSAYHVLYNKGHIIVQTITRYEAKIPTNTTASNRKYQQPFTRSIKVTSRFSILNSITQQRKKLHTLCNTSVGTYVSPLSLYFYSYLRVFFASNLQVYEYYSSCSRPYVNTCHAVVVLILRPLLKEEPR